MKIGEKKFSELDKKDFGIVILGAGEPLDEWVSGIDSLFKKENIAATHSSVFREAFVLNDNVAGKEGRQDLVLVFSEDARLNVGALAMWRLRFGDCSWIDDFKVNYKSDYISGGI